MLNIQYCGGVDIFNAMRYTVSIPQTAGAQWHKSCRGKHEAFRLHVSCGIPAVFVFLYELRKNTNIRNFVHS